jgi:hypothetical protein
MVTLALSGLGLAALVEFVSCVPEARGAQCSACEVAAAAAVLAAAITV